MPDSAATYLRAVRDFEMAMHRLGRTMMTVGDSYNKFRRHLARRSRLAPVAVKPALRGRRHGW